MDYMVYLQTDTNGTITAINSSAFLNDITGWTKIDEGVGDKYHHAQNNYLENGLTDSNGYYNYELVNSVITLKSDAEKQPTLQVTKQKKINEIYELYNQKLTEGFKSSANGIELDFGYAQTDRDKFIQLALKILLKGVSAFPVTVHPKDGSSVSLDQSQYTQLVDDIDAFANPLDLKQHDYIVQVNNCENNDDVNKIVVQF